MRSRSPDRRFAAVPDLRYLRRAGTWPCAAQAPLIRPHRSGPPRGMPCGSKEDGSDGKEETQAGRDCREVAAG